MVNWKLDSASGGGGGLTIAIVTCNAIFSVLCSLVHQQKRGGALLPKKMVGLFNGNSPPPTTVSLICAIAFCPEKCTFLKNVCGQLRPVFLTLCCDVVFLEGLKSGLIP